MHYLLGGGNTFTFYHFLLVHLSILLTTPILLPLSALSSFSTVHIAASTSRCCCSRGRPRASTKGARGAPKRRRSPAAWREAAAAGPQEERRRGGECSRIEEGPCPDESSLE